MENEVKDKSLFRRYLDDLYTTEDARRLMEDFQKMKYDSDLISEMSFMVWEDSLGQVPQTDLEREQYKKEARLLLKRLKQRKHSWSYRVAAIVASAAVVLGIVWGSIYFSDYASHPQVSYREVFTSYGEHKSLQLPDGTELILNSCSRIRYPMRFLDEERRVELEGEGYFRVQRDEKHPFVVGTRHFDVRVLGTSFDVKAYLSDEIVSVDVESGKVQVDLPEAMMRLGVKEQIFINTVSGEYNKQHKDCTVAVWRNGKLRFNSTPLRDVIKELERVYNCRISFAPGQEFTNILSGEHDNMSLEDMLQSIEYTCGIHYKKEGDYILLYR